MLTDDECDKVFSAWREMTPDEQAHVRFELELRRIDAWVHDRFSFNQLETWRVNSKKICEDMASNSWPGAAPAIELEALNRLLGPKVAAWERVSECFNAAARDKTIKANPDAMELLLLAVGIASDCCDSMRSVSDFTDLGITEGSITMARSMLSRNAAMSKNAKPRAWVLSEWEKRTDKGQNKASFARQYSQLVKRQFDVDVKPDTIARDWLPKSNP